MRELLNNKKVKIAIIIFIALALIMIVWALFSVYQASQRPKAPSIEYDPASQQEITTFTGYNTHGQNSYFIGFDKLVEVYGMDRDIYETFMSSMEVFAADQNINLKRVSMYKDSFKQRKDADEVHHYYTFKIVVNVNQKDYYAKVRPVRYGIADVYLFEDEAMTKKAFEKCSVITCPRENIVPTDGI